MWPSVSLVRTRRAFQRQGYGATSSSTYAYVRTIRPTHHRNDAFRAFVMRNHLEERKRRSMLVDSLCLGHRRCYFQSIQTKMADDASRGSALYALLFTLEPKTMLLVPQYIRHGAESFHSSVSYHLHQVDPGRLCFERYAHVDCCCCCH